MLHSQLSSPCRCLALCSLSWKSPHVKVTFPYSSPVMMQLYKDYPSSLSACFSFSFCPPFMHLSAVPSFSLNLHQILALNFSIQSLLLLLILFCLFFFFTISLGSSMSISFSVSLSFCHVSGGHSRSNSGSSESNIPNLARSLLLVDQLIDL